MAQRCDLCRDHVEKTLTPLFQFFLADPGDHRQLAHGLRFELRHLNQGGVVEDGVRRHFQLAGQFETVL